jgi:hypothetical protein
MAQLCPIAAELLKVVMRGGITWMAGRTIIFTNRVLNVISPCLPAYLADIKYEVRYSRRISRKITDPTNQLALVMKGFRQAKTAVPILASNSKQMDVGAKTKTPPQDLSESRGRSAPTGSRLSRRHTWYESHTLRNANCGWPSLSYNNNYSRCAIRSRK